MVLGKGMAGIRIKQKVPVLFCLATAIDAASTQFLPPSLSLSLSCPLRLSASFSLNFLIISVAVAHFPSSSLHLDSADDTEREFKAINYSSGIMNLPSSHR